MTNFSQLNRRLNHIIENFDYTPEVTQKGFINMMMSPWKNVYSSGQQTNLGNGEG